MAYVQPGDMTDFSHQLAHDKHLMQLFCVALGVALGAHESCGFDDLPPTRTGKVCINSPDSMFDTFHVTAFQLMVGCACFATCGRHAMAGA